MADIIDVENALVSLIAQTLYPNGIGQAAAIAASCRVYAGWPQAQQLNTDLAAGVCHVSVFPSQIERNSTRHLREWQQLSVNMPTLTLTQLGQQITVGGTIPAAFTAQNLSILMGGAFYVYATQSTDTLTSIATALAALIAGASSAGPVITLPATANVTALRVGTTGTMWRELRRQERVMMLSIWSPTPALRDAIGGLIDTALADIAFLTMPDQSSARISYKNSVVIDDRQKAALYRRDLNYSVEYATTQTTTATQVTQISESIGQVIDTPATSTPVSTVTINS